MAHRQFDRVFTGVGVGPDSQIARCRVCIRRGRSHRMNNHHSILDNGPGEVLYFTGQHAFLLIWCRPG